MSTGINREEREQLDKLEQEANSIWSAGKNRIDVDVPALQMLIARARECLELREQLDVWRYAADFQKDDAGYRLGKLLAGTKPSEFYGDFKQRLESIRVKVQAVIEMDNRARIELRKLGIETDDSQSTQLLRECVKLIESAAK